jgi:hypothetical protein
MMRRGLLALAVLMSPEVVEAQRGSSSGAPPVRGVTKNSLGDRGANYRIDASVPIAISNKDVARLSPAKALLDMKKDLALTDDQVKQLNSLESELEVQNDTLFRQLDSLRKEMRVNRNATNPQVEEMRARSARTATHSVIKAIREAYDKAEPTALAVLAEAQQKTGTELLNKQLAEAEETLMEKLGAGRRGG